MNSSGEYVFSLIVKDVEYSPPCPRKVGIPLSAEIPAPVIISTYS